MLYILCSQCTGVFLYHSSFYSTEDGLCMVSRGQRSRLQLQWRETHSGNRALYSGGVERTAPAVSLGRKSLARLWSWLATLLSSKSPCVILNWFCSSCMCLLHPDPLIKEVKLTKADICWHHTIHLLFGNDTSWNLKLFLELVGTFVPTLLSDPLHQTMFWCFLTRNYARGHGTLRRWTLLRCELLPRAFPICLKDNPRVGNSFLKDPTTCVNLVFWCGL